MNRQTTRQHVTTRYLLLLLLAGISITYTNAAAAAVAVTAEEEQSTLRRMSTDGTAMKRIVGGASADNIYPYYGISKRGDLCGVTLIHSDIAVTVAHCAGVFRGIGLFMGGVELSGDDAIAEFDVIAEYPHPRFNENTLENDIMLIKLSKRVSSNIIQPIAKINTDAAIPADNSVVTVIGFGTTKENGRLPEFLQKVDVNVMSGQACASLYRENFKSKINNQVVICAAAYGKDACQGDSGGPLLQELDGTLQLVGLVSWGIGCARSKAPGVYTRISAYAKFIESRICAYSSDKPASCDQEVTEPVQVVIPDTPCPSSNECPRPGSTKTAYSLHLVTGGRCLEMCTERWFDRWKKYKFECGKCEE